MRHIFRSIFRSIKCAGGGWLDVFGTSQLCSYCSQTASAELLVCVRNPRLPLAACLDLRKFLFCSRAPMPKTLGPPKEKALQQLSNARWVDSLGWPPRSGLAHSSFRGLSILDRPLCACRRPSNPKGGGAADSSSVAAQLSHSSSTLTNGSSSIYTASMSSTDTVLPRMSGPATAQSGGLRKRPTADTASSAVSTRRQPCPDAVKAGSAPPALSWT